MPFSRFGQKLTRQDAGILSLMDDLGRALSGDSAMLMLGGGNPGHVPEVHAALRQRMKTIMSQPGELERMFGNYAGQQGDQAFLDALADFFHAQYGWPVSAANIALTNGSQNAFFLLFNLLGGEYPDGSNKKIILPLTPEYIGYSDVSLSEQPFVAYRPDIEILPENFFKYHIRFDDLHIDDNTAAICVSRPTNPSGNVLTQTELERLSALAKQHHIPLIIDNAYGTPFPHIIFTEAQPLWDEHIILCLSLSKIGLPAVRSGIIIANEEIITAVAAMNAITNLAPTSIGSRLALDWIRSGEMIRLSQDAVKPFYHAKMQRAVEYLHTYLKAVPYRIHQPEGALFLWLWFENLPGGSMSLYETLKQNGVLIVPGDYFFPGLEHETWAHKHECIRLNYAQDEAVVEAGIKRLGRVLRAIYR
jgi:valine--pyruvate aminotransferase